MRKKQFFTVAVTAAFMGLGVNHSAWAAESSAVSEAGTEQLIQKMAAQTSSLESQMKVLKKQIRELKAQEQELKKVQQATPVMTPGVLSNQRRAAIAREQGASVQSQSSETVIPTVGHNEPGMMYITGSPVVIAPFVGEHTAFDALDLITNYSSYNEDLQLLQLRQKTFLEYERKNNCMPTGPLLMLSGKVEGQGIYQKPYTGYGNSHFDLSSAELDVIPTLNEWANGFISMKYDNSQVQQEPLVSNSRVYVDRAFMTIGNLHYFPIYMTLGQINVPFGTYSSNMISSPLTDLVFHTKGRALLLGYHNNSSSGPYAEIYGFNGDASPSDADNVNDLGANLGVTYNGSVNVDAGVGAIANVADALGMQKTGAATGSFEGFSKQTDTQKQNNINPEKLHRQVPGVATHFNLGIGQFGGYAEYITPTMSFAYNDMNYDHTPAKPRALNVEAYYNFRLFDTPEALTIGYGKSWDALALNVPDHRYVATLNAAIWKETIESIEFRHDTNYDKYNSATAMGVMIPASAKGGSSNTVTAQIGIYF